MITLRLTAADLGVDEFFKAELDRRKYPHPLEAKRAAVLYGTLCATRIGNATTDSPWITDAGREYATEDAVMFAKLAFHGWRAYRIMVGE